MKEVLQKKYPYKASEKEITHLAEAFVFFFNVDIWLIYAITLGI